MSERADGGAKMFDAIAPGYDRLNRLMSLGLDRVWRERLVRSIAVARPARILDVATGTGDVLLRLREEYPHAELVGIDPSAEMLARAAAKLRGDSKVSTQQGSAMDLPYADASFDAVTVAFGLRNFPDRQRGVLEMARVLRPGGALSILELTDPRGLLAPIARVHVHRIVPMLGRWLSRGAPYEYLSESIAAFPPPAEVCAWLRGAQLTRVRATPMTLGAVHIFAGIRC
ncbi:MAG: ubiquinone/menaquinone biosynthesis methyltransferase [Deltaproteobacteria bacterium]|nr:ubiquinone/menaquinone biosynthesis methyltransferase [Deltaproteobacteria bacterium]